MRILLTGAAGFIGSHLAERLIARGDTVVGVDDFNDYYDPAIKRRNVPAGMTLREGDLCDAEAMGRLLAEQKPEVVVHLAARAGVRASIADPVLYDRVNVGGTLGLIEQMRAYGPNRLVFASSSSVYGGAAVPFREDESAPAPLSSYGASKLAAEHFIRIHHNLHGLRAVMLRFFTVFGPRQRPDMAMHKFARLMRAGKPITVYGAGDTERDYTYIDDIIHGIVAAIDRNDALEIYNLGGHRTTPLRDVIATLEWLLKVKAKIDRQPEHPADPRKTYADITKSQKDLRFAPTVGIDEGLQRFVTWLNAAAD